MSVCSCNNNDNGDDDDDNDDNKHINKTDDNQFNK